MADWLGYDTPSTADVYRRMAERELQQVSPVYATLCRHIADNAELIAALDRLEPPKRQPNLLLASVRFLGGPVTWPAFHDFVVDRWDDVQACLLSRRTQTNEAARCTALLPILAALPQPLALLEVGASAGLCLFPDRYRYDHGGTLVGDDGPVLRCETSGPVPVPMHRPDVVWRAGLDLNPLDVIDDADVRWLESLVWPGQDERFDTLRAAVEIARSDPPRIVTGDLTTDLAAVAADAPPDATLVVYHSAVLAYVPEAGRHRFVESVHELAATRSTCWIANEAGGVVDGTDRFAENGRFVVSRDGNPVGRSGPHGRFLQWFD